MTDYEMFNALSETVALLWTIFSIYVSIVFAFLVASHLAARQLASKIVSLVITLYTLVATWALFGLNRSAATLAAIIEETKRAVRESDSSLDWHPMIGTPDAFSTVFPYVILIIGLTVYIASIVFFFHERKSDSLG
jgi:hypothetical protein